MGQTEPVRVTGRDGLSGVIERRDLPDRKGAAQVLILLDDGQRIVVPAEALVAREDGTYYLWIGAADLERARGESALHSDEPLVVPVIAEELRVERRAVETGRVRLNKVVREREEVVDEPLLREEVHVERVPVNRVVEGEVQVRHEGDTMIIPVLEEVLVVEKRLMLKEELRVTRRRVEERRPQTVTLRSEEVTVERVEPQEQEIGGKHPA